MPSKNENDVLNVADFEYKEVSLDELEQSLETELEEKVGDLNFLQEEHEHINNPDHLGETVLNVVWEQFMNQVATTAGEDFIKENRGLHLDLRKEAHIQTTENFAAGKIATHNTEIDYQQRYDDWQSNFVKDENGNVVTHQTRSGKEEATLVEGARKLFDDERKRRGLVGNAAKGTDMDETVPVAEIIRDPSANAHMTQEERIEFDLSEKNLNEMDSRWNRSKGDTPTNEWLDNANSKGQKPQEVFDNMTDEDVEKLRQKDAEARAEFEKKKKEAEQKSIEAGKKSQKEEAFRIGGKALRTAFMAILAALVKEVIGKLVLWLKSAEKSLKSLLEHIKMAICSFVGKLKGLLVSTSDSVITTIATSIVGPVVGTIKKVFMLLKQGWKSLKEAVQFLRKPENRGKPLSYLLPQVGIIVVTGLSGIGAIALGEIIEKGLIALLPGLGVDIPILGSPANLIGMLMGAIVCGVIGAIAINLINKQVAKQQRNENLSAQIDKKNEVLQTQDKLIKVKIQKMGNAKENAVRSMKDTREQAKDIISEAMTTIFREDEEDHSEILNSIAEDLADLLS